MPSISPLWATGSIGSAVGPEVIASKGVRSSPAGTLRLNELEEEGDILLYFNGVSEE